MPAIYRILRGESKNFADELLKRTAGDVFMDGLDAGELVSFYLALRKDDDWVPIPHPCEETALRSNGETLSSATWKGILWGLNPHLCMGCGSVIYVPKMTPFVPFGCLVPIILGIGIGIYYHSIAGLAVMKSAEYGFIGMYVVYLLVFGSGEVIARLRFGSIQNSLTPSSCAKCGATDRRSVSSLQGKTVKLSNGKYVHVSFWGIS